MAGRVILLAYGIEGSKVGVSVALQGHPRSAPYPVGESLCMSKSLVEMASEIIAIQARHAPMSPEEISEGVKKIFAILQQLQGLEASMPGTSDGEGIGKLTPQDSIQRHRVICLECHKEFKLLSNRHLALHGMNSRAYKLKYGLPMRQALSAKSLTLARRKIAKEKGLGEKLVAHRRQRT